MHTTKTANQIELKTNSLYWRIIEFAQFFSVQRMACRHYVSKQLALGRHGGQGQSPVDNEVQLIKTCQRGRTSLNCKMQIRLYSRVQVIKEQLANAVMGSPSGSAKRTVHWP